MSQDDRECIRQSLNSHPEAFGGLVKRYQAALLAYLDGQLGDATQAEDAAQETLVRAFFSLDKLKKPESFFSWLLGIAKRVANEQRRAERRHRKELRLASERGPSQSISHDSGMEEAVAGLPDSYREIILLRYYAGLSCGQVAERLALPLGTVTKKLSRSYTMLRKTLQRQERTEKRIEVKR